MREPTRFFKLVALGLFVSFATIVQAQEDYRAGVLHVKFKKELTQQVAGMRVMQSARGTAITGMAAVDQISSLRGGRKFKRIFREAGRYEAAHRAYGLHLWYEIEYDSTFAAGQVKADYEGTNQFERVERPRKLRQIGPVSPGPMAPMLPAGTNDPLFGDQWHYENTGQTGGTAGADISLVPAWTIETGSNQVIVAVIDGGIDILHPDLSAAMWVNTDEVAGNGIDDDLNGYVDDVNGYGFGDNTGTLHPNFHGTHVAGTIGAVTNNSVGVSGIAGGSGTGNGVRLMSCAGFGLFGVGGFEDAMVYAADNGAVISQNSWGGGSSAIEDAIDYFIARAGLDNSDANFGLNIQTGPMRGGIVIFAAGNSSTSDPSLGYPGSYDPVMAVASTDHNDTRSSFSNYGTWVDIAAPGSSVFSTYPVDLGSYALLSGTSMACPHVSGVAALVISKFKASGYLPEQVWGRLQETADNIDAQNPSLVGLLGSGRLNAFHALETDDGVAPDPITDLAVSSELLTSIKLTWTATGGSGLVGAASYYDLRYSTSPITEANFSSATRDFSSPKPKVSGSTEVYEVPGLLPTTTYYFAVKAGDFFGNLSSMSNVVSATTPEPPIIGVSPSSLSQTLYTGGQATQFLTISNTGASDLILDITIQSIAPSSVSNARVGNGKIFAGLKQANAAQTKAYRNLASWQSRAPGARVKPAAGPFPATAGRIFLLTGPDVISEISPADGSVIHTIPTPELASGGPDGLAFDGSYLYFINSFGSSTYYKIDPADGSVEGTLSLPATGSVDALGHSGTFLYALDYSSATIYEIDFDSGIVVRSISPGVSIVGGLSFGGSRGTLFASDFSSAIYEINLNTGDVINTISPTGVIYGLGYSEGAGLLFAQNVSSNTTEAYNPDTGEVAFSLPSGFSSALASDEAGDQWLKVGEGSLVAAGESIEVQITFDAQGLNGGDYFSNILVKSNDPVTPLVTVPVSLHVDGAPNISLSPAALEFGDTYIGAHPLLTLSVGNDGTDALTVTNFSIDPGFFIEAGGETPFSLDPGESRNLTIRFSPVAVGEVTGYVQVDSDDPDQPNVAVSLSGFGIEAPTILVAPSSITSNLFTGESEDHAMTVHNSGGSNLTVQIDLELHEPSSITPQTVQPTISSQPNNSGVRVESGNPGYYPEAVGDFSRLADTPTPLTCFTIDPTTQFIYGQRNGGNQFYRYDPATNLWTTLASSPVASANNGGATYLNGKIYAVYTFTDQIAVYDIASNIWTNTTTPIATGNITSDGTYIYASVGYELKRLDPSTGIWTDLASPPFYFQPWGALAYYNGKIYGHEGNGYTGFAEYSIAGNTWATLPSIPSGAVLGATIDPSQKNYYAYGSYGGNNLYIYNIPNATWSTVSIPLFLLNDGGLAYVKKPGKRGVYFLSGESGIEFAKFETPGSDWLQVDPASGEVGVGETLNFNARINAAGLNGGEYSATILFNSNDPLTPQVSVPVTLTVTGAPDLSLSPIGINFSQVFVDSEKSYELTLTNEGTDVLNILSSDSDTPQFTVGQPATYLLPGESDTVLVTFRPTAPGPLTGRITIQTNDPTEPLMYVDLEGFGLMPPIIGVSPSEITSNLFVNQVEERTLSVQNSGGSLLEFDIRVEVEGPSGFPSPGSAPWVRPNASPGSNNYSLPEANVPENFVPLAPGNFSPLASSPVNLTCIAIDPVTQTIYAQQNSGTGFYKYDVTTNAWASLATCPLFSGNNGGAVFLDGRIYTVYTEYPVMGIYTVSTNTWTSVSSPTTTANIASDGTYVYTVVSNLLYRYDPNSLAWMQMASPPFYYERWGALVHDKGFLYGHQGNGNTGFARYTIATNSWTTMPTLPSGAVLGGAIDSQSKVYYAYGNYEGTNLYAFDLTSNSWSTATIPLFAINDGGMVHVKKAGKKGIYFIQGERGNGFAKFEPDTGANWLVIETSSASVDVGETMNLPVQINATGLIGGEYSATITFESNDPLTPVVVVPVTLTVTGASDITLSPVSMNFGQVFVGGEKSFELTISNDGSDALNIASASSNSPHFTVSQPVASLGPGEIDKVDVTFKPLAPGSFVGIITIHTNDPVNPQVYVELSGDGLPPPIIGVTPGSLSETLMAGKQVTRMLTIRNTGSSDLTFGKAIELNSVEPWPSPPDYGNGRISSGVKPGGSPINDAYGNNSLPQSSWISSAPKQPSGPTPAAAGRIFNLSGPNTISEVNTANGSTISSMATPETASGGPDGLAFDGTYLYFTNSAGTKKFYQIDPQTGAVIRERSIPSIDYIDALAHSGTFLYALNYSSGIIYEIDFAAGTVIRSITPGVSMGGGMSFGGHRGTIFVSSFSSSIYEIELATGIVKKTFTPSGTIYGLGYSVGTGFLYAQNISTNSIDAYNPDTGVLAHSLLTGYSSALASDEGTAPSWLKVGPGSLVAAGQSIQVSVDFNAKDLDLGEYTASIIFNSNDPVHPVVTVPVTLTVTVATGIEPGQVVDLTLSPNPASKELHASFTLSAEDMVEFTLTDLTGKTLWSVSETRDSGRNTFTSDVSSLSEGLYLFRFASRGYVTTRRVIILRD